MDRRSWLWRRKSSDKSPGAETDSSVSGSGSLSSPSERFSDEHQASPNQNTQSPEVTSKVAPPDEDANDGVKILTEKLSAAIATITAKEELVKQHSKVAEEAVTGWEKAENEAVTLKQQLDIATKKNSSLEDRVVHLDGALKECLRQLRQVREEKNEKAQEAISKKSQDAESKSELDIEMSDLLAQLETANAKVEAAASLESDLRFKLDSVETENASLRQELNSRLEELKIMTLERDLSTKTAETASKQHLESIKRVAKLEAECRKLKTMARKVTYFNDSKSFNDSQSDSGERLNECELSHSDSWSSGLKIEKGPSKSHMPPSPEIGLMDDFLEMEKLAALPESENRSRSLGPATLRDKHSTNDSSSLKSELDAMAGRITELEEKIEIVESEKIHLASVLSQCQNKLKISEAQLSSCQNQLKISQAQLREANKKLEMLQAELDLANELRQAIDLELDDANVRREEAESQHRAIEDEREMLLSKVRFLEGETEKERALYADSSEKCRALEDELSRMKHEFDKWQSQLASMNKSKEAAEQELLSTTVMKEAAESQLKDVNSEAKSLLAKIGSLEKEAKKERQLSAEFSGKCKLLENELSRIKHDADSWRSQLASVNGSKEAVNRELQMTNAKKEEAESQLKAILAKVGTLEHEVEKERAMSAEFAAKCRKLEHELTKLKSEADFQLSPISKDELNKQQEKELAVAANKMAECQKTIASLGNQLKSLAALEDLFLDSEKLLEVSRKESLLQNDVKPDTLSSDTNTSTLSKEDDGKLAKDEAKAGISLDRRDKHGLGKYFPRTKSTIKS
ncbi:filament-like plant protein 3 [Chenopodium quinoa]|uniref:Filament-like plant protein n=1 Tax=Chenopodium quinoa TaxID=63459 RepID=A0A803KNE8_CHEQI|nr:filament-like plant protein 3 [Chenopodium quinoa]XP_021772636.1 filament-like plant protein 3 [Chenopodium quinoa]